VLYIFYRNDILSVPLLCVLAIKATQYNTRFVLKQRNNNTERSWLRHRVS